jgi:hypothetical protein
MKRRYIYWCAGALTAGLAGALAWATRPAVSAASAFAHAATAGALEARAPAHAPARGARPRTLQVLAAATDDQLLQVQVARLLATHDPADAFRAYELGAECDGFNRNHDLLVFDEEEFKRWKGDTLPGYRGMNASEKAHETRICSGMTERERVARLDYLAVAVAAGVPGAAVAFAHEGPFGDASAPKTRPDDPLVVAWKATAKARLSEAAETGDMKALNYWQGQNAGGSDLTEQNTALSYRYLLAQGLIESDRLGPNSGIARLYAPDGDLANGMAGDLNAAQRAAELAAARRIADVAKERRKHAPAS